MKQRRYLFLFIILLNWREVTRAQDLKTEKKDGLIEVTLNGLKITVDKNTGSILGMEYPGPGEILKAVPAQSGILDVAYPVAEFEPLRLAAAYSSHATIKVTGNSLVISWESLGPSRPYFHISGNVSATVWMKAMDDGQSISMKCRIENKSDSSIRQVLFPDFHGLLPVDGRTGTCLRTAGFVRKPFIDVGATMYPEFYALDDKTRPVDTRDTYLYYGGGGLGNGDEMIGRWLDYGGLNGGISIFPKLWGTHRTTVRVFRLEKDPKVRLMFVHNNTIRPGESWESPEYVLTPHQYGWAKGVEPYRKFVHDHIHRRFPVPEHVREGLGFRTVYMSRGYPADKTGDHTFTFADLPRVAKYCKSHGIDQLVIWWWLRHFILPIPAPYDDLGTPEDLSKAIKACNKIGVNVALTLSITSVSGATASRYGLKVGKSGWTYHPEMIPRFNPSYAHSRASVHANTKDPRWQKDVMASVKKVYQDYTHAINWDQCYTTTKSIIQKFLPLVRKSDPEATFSGEVTGCIEEYPDFMDFTWNWQLGSYYHNGRKEYRDVRAYNAVFPAPRLNYNINRNAQDIKYAFMDNSYVNIMPSAPDGANGSAWLKDYPDIGEVLKQCAGLRKQFLKFFTGGMLIGDCLLQEECPGTHINAYVLKDRILFIVMNTSNEYRSINFRVNLGPWIKSSDGKYKVKSYDQYGTHFGADKITGPCWSGKTLMLRKYGLAFFEFIAQ